MQVVIDKLQAGAQKAQAVACKLEAPQPSAQGEEALVSSHAYHTVVHRDALPLLRFDCVFGLTSSHVLITCLVLSCCHE